MKVRYSYLPQQFENCDDLWDDLKAFVATGDFTLGEPLKKFEDNFAKLIGTKYAVGVNSGTDALKLSLKTAGIKAGDEVITTANTFVATVGSIVELGAKPIFVDCDDTFCMNVDLVEQRISDKTKAIVPVHYAGYMTDMRKLLVLSNKYKLPVLEDACQAILSSIENKKSGTWGLTGSFSLHPLKNINVWSDGGMIVTDDTKIYENLLLLRNHGLADRNTVKIMGYNSRLDTFQSIVGNWLLPKAEEIASQRIQNANHLDNGFSLIDEITIPIRPKDYKIVYHLYIVFAKNRDNLIDYCLKNGVEARIHYPIPIYRQEGLSYLNHQIGDFPVADKHAREMISFPCDQHLEKKQLDYIITTVKNFYKGQ